MPFQDFWKSKVTSLTEVQIWFPKNMQYKPLSLTLIFSNIKWIWKKLSMDDSQIQLLEKYLEYQAIHMYVSAGLTSEVIKGQVMKCKLIHTFLYARKTTSFPISHCNSILTVEKNMLNDLENWKVIYFQTFERSHISKVVLQVNINMWCNSSLYTHSCWDSYWR